MMKSIDLDLSKLSHGELETLLKEVEQELERRWKLYEESPELFRPVAAEWSDLRLERYISLAELEVEYGQRGKLPATVEIARQELERRQNAGGEQF